MFFHMEDVPYYFEDKYGRVWVREKDFERVKYTLLPYLKELESVSTDTGA